MAAARLGFRRLFSVSAFAPPPPAAARPAAEPSTNLFVSGLNKRTTSETLREAFAKFGQVVDARVIADRVSGYSRGFGFVRFASIEEAEAGIKSMDGKKFLTMPCCWSALWPGRATARAAVARKRAPPHTATAAMQNWKPSLAAISERTVLPPQVAADEEGRGEEEED